MVKKLCPRCRKVINVDQNYCTTCTSKVNSNYNRDYDKNRRNKDSKFFYASKTWKLKREEILSYYADVDLYDYYVNNVVSTAEVIHHIHELADNPNLALDNDNLIPLTASNHTRIHELYKTDRASTIRLLEELVKMWQSDCDETSGTCAPLAT